MNCCDTIWRSWIGRRCIECCLQLLELLLKHGSTWLMSFKRVHFQLVLGFLWFMVLMPSMATTLSIMLPFSLATLASVLPGDFVQHHFDVLLKMPYKIMFPRNISCYSRSFCSWYLNLKGSLLIPFKEFPSLVCMNFWNIM